MTRRRPLRAAALAALTAAAFASCRAAERPTAPRPQTLRLLEQEPRAPFALVDPSLAPADESALSWRASWRRRPSAAGALARAGEPTELQLRDALDADVVAGFELVSAARLREPPRLAWTAGTSCSPAGAALDGEVAGRTVDGGFRYLLLPFFEPCWRGRLDGVALTIVGSLPGEPPLRSLRMLGRAETTHALERSAGAERRVDLDGEVRDAVVALPGSRRLWPISPLPERATLRFAFAVDAFARRDTTLRVTLAADGAPAAQLFAAEVGPGRPGFGRWVETGLPLASWAGRSVEIELAVDGDREPGRPPTVAFFADARIETEGGDERTEPPSIVLVSVDTLRADRLSLYGNARPTSPRLDRWAAASAVVFDRAIAQAPWTLPSHASILTGLEPLRHGVNLERPAGEEIETIAETLRARGYRTLAVTGGAWMSRSFGLDQGFDVFSYSPTQDDRDRELARGVERLLALVPERPSAPLFLFFHTYHVHGPHRARAPWFERWSRFDARFRVADEPAREEPETGRKPNGPPKLLRGEGRGFEALPHELAELPFDLYDSAVAEMDEQVGRLLDELKRRLGDRKTLVVFTSDHGESLGEMGLGGHNNLRPEVVRVPLVVEFPDRAWRGRRVAAQVRSVDIVPTLLEALGLPGGAGRDGAALQAAAREPERAPDRPAWTYSATAPWSLGLRLADRPAWDLSLSPWGGARGGARRVAPPAADALSPVDPDERLQRSMLEQVRRLGRGLFVTATAPAGAPFVVELDAGAVERGAVKLLGPPPNAAPELGPDGLRLRLAPGERLELWFEQLAPRSVTVRTPAVAVDRSRTVESVVPDATPLLLAWADGRWSRIDPSAPAPPFAPTVRLVWQGPGRPTSPGDLDPETESQLRALGYLP